MLTESMIKRIKLGNKKRLEIDSDGLYLAVYPSGKKTWTVRTWIGGKAKQTTIGEYPYMSLTEARRKRDEIKHGARTGEAIELETFGEFMRRWYRERIEPTLAKSTKASYELRLKYLAPIQGIPLTELTRKQILELLHKLEREHPLETVRRTAGIVGMVTRHALTLGKIQLDPAAYIKEELSVHVSRRMPAATNDADIATVIRALDTIDAYYPRAALKLIAYTFVRSGEATQARWSEFDFDNALWNVPAEHTKTKHDHLIPLARQAVELLRPLRLRSGGKGLVFPSRLSGKRLEPSTLSRYMAELQRLPPESRPIQTVPHGFRATASTVLNEHGWPPDAIEAQLAHYDSNKVRRVYNRAEYLPVRREIMQWYADYLDALRDGTPKPKNPA